LIIPLIFVYDNFWNIIQKNDKNAALGDQIMESGRYHIDICRRGVLLAHIVLDVQQMFQGVAQQLAA
jgi:hypothetical protein